MVGKDDAAVGRHGLAETFDTLGEEEHHGVVVVLAAAILTTVEQVADGVEADDVGRGVWETDPHGFDHQREPLVVEDHAELGRGEQIVARAGNHRPIQPDLLHTLAEIVVLDLRLQIENAQRLRRREAEERHAGRHVGEKADQEIALADLRRAAENQQASRREHARRDDVRRHGRAVVEKLAKREHRQRLGLLLSVRLVAQQRRAVLLHMQGPKAVSFLLQAFRRPGRPKHGGVVLADGLPAIVRAELSLVHQPHVMTDGCAGALEAGPRILAALMHRGGENGVEGGLCVAFRRRLGAHAGNEGHGGHTLAEVGQVHFDCIMLTNLHEPLESALVIDGASDPDRLVGGAEVGVAAHLHGDVAAQAAQRGEVIARRGLGQFPPHMELERALGRTPAAFHHQGGRTEMVDQMAKLGDDVPGVEIHHHGLHLEHLMGARLALALHGSGNDIESRTLAPRPVGEGLQLVER